MHTTIESDVVVIGSGIGGVMAAYQLASKGKQVTLLEQGVRLSRDQVQRVFDAQSFIGHPDVPLKQVEFVDDKKRGRPIPSVVGGLARFYSAVSLRMREREFDRWPFPYRDLEPYYSRAEHLMRISGKSGDDPLDPPRSVVYPLELPPMSEHAKRLSNGAKDLGLTPFQHPLAIDFGGGCVRCNHCNQVPCAHGVKWNPDSFLSEHAALPIRLYDQMSAVRFHMARQGSDRRMESVEAVHTASGESHRFTARHFFVAGGALLTPLLLTRSGLRDMNPLIGTNLMTHCLGLVVGMFPFTMSAEGDFHKWWSVSDYYYNDDGSVRGLIQQDHLTARKKVFAKIPRWLHGMVAMGYYKTCQLLVIAEDEPQQGNHVEANGSGNVIRVRHHFSERDETQRTFLAKQAEKIMKRAGALIAHTFKGKSIYHACGTCHMGISANTSVTDSSGLVWGTTNLSVADASLFPTSSGVNPSLTIAALALRIADLIP